MKNKKEALSQSDLSAMTVNERLYVSGLFEAFDKALAENDREELRTILRTVCVDSKSIEKIIENEISGK